jgi:LmbE family N-acetylglucosaminyl deacetylase
LRYPYDNVSTTDPAPVVSHLMNATRRIRPGIVICAGQDEDINDPKNVVISRLMTTAFDHACLNSHLPLSSRLYYLAPFDSIPEHDIAVARGHAVSALIRIDITEYVVTKARARQCHKSQVSRYKIAVEQVGSKLEIYEGLSYHAQQDHLWIYPIYSTPS